MQIILYILLVLALLVVIYQDLKMRLIHVLLPIAILVFGTILRWHTLDFMEMGMSFLFLVLNFAAITIYFSLKKRAFTNPFDTMIGLGDALFLIALTPLFSFRSYLLFFVLGMLFSLILYGILGKVYTIQKTVPLAGYLSIFILGVMGIQLLTENKLLL